MITEIKYTKRFNIGDYQHEEYSVCFAVGEECPVKAMQNLKIFVEDSHKDNLSVPLSEVESAGREVVKENGEVRDAEMVDIKVEEEPKKKAKKKTKKKVVKKEANIKYDRTKEDHKKIFAGAVTKKFPGWLKDADLRSKAATTSKFLEGFEMLSPDGSILEEFSESVVEKMSE